MLIWMLLFLAAVGIVCALLFPPLRTAFQANQVFNGMILGVLAVGIVINFLQVFTLGPATDWIDDVRDVGAPPASDEAPRLLASMATMTFTTNAGPFDISLRPDGTDGYEDLAERTQQLRYRDRDVPVASLEDVIRSKEAAGREKDLLVIPALRAHLRRMD